MIKKRLLVIVMFLVALPIMAKIPLYKDASQPVEKRVNDLLQRMTLEEKVAQMCQYVGPEHIRKTQLHFRGKEITKNDDAYGFYPTLSINDLYRLIEEGKVGSFLHVVTAEEANQLQKLAQKSRLQIPLIFGIDAIHGNALVNGATVYPTPIGQASSFDTILVNRLSRETALEMRATGIQWTFTPNVDIARDARWGRIGETYGEDPYLVTRMGVAAVKGFQKNNCEGKDAVLACTKHLIAGSEPSNGTNFAPMDVSERTLREIFLPPYKAAVEEAGVFTVMAAHNELNGVPCHINRWMMTDIIREEYGFKGFIISDWMDVEHLNELHRTAPSLKEAYYETVNAGLDMHMHGPGFMEGVIELVQEGRLSETQIDKACRTILEAKFKLGLFENPFVDLKHSGNILFNKEHQATALKAAEESIVLLKNEEELLPLDFAKYRHILVTGPNADNQAVLGDWTLKQPDKNVVTILEGIRAIAGDKHVTYYNYGDNVRQNSPNKVEEATKLAAKSDLAIIVVGENPLRYQKNKTCGEDVDRMSLDLLGTQNELVKKIYETGVPTIVILVGGRPLSVNWIAEHVPALIQAWEPGSFAGTALANILSGKVNPSAKLPVSIPRYVGQIQMIYNHKPSQYFRKYIDGAHTPLYPFGYGLSYTTFVYSDVCLSKKECNSQESFTASVDLTNTGKREGTEIVQLYIHDVYSSATRPVKELKDFMRVTLKPGETRRVTFTVSPDKLAYYDRSMTYGVEPGEFEVMIGCSSQDKDLKLAKIKIK